NAEVELQRANAGIEQREQQIKQLTQQLAGHAPLTRLPATPRSEPDHGPAGTEVRRRAELELAAMRHAEEELNRQLAREQQPVAEANRYAEELQGQLQQKTADLERARAESEKRKRQFEAA